MIDAGELKKGITIELDGELYQVVDYQHIKVGRGSAHIRLRLRGIRTGHNIERSFQASEKFTQAFLEHRPIQYLYNDDNLYYFMDTESFEQIPLDKAKLSETLDYLKEGLNLEMLTYKGETVGIDLPISIELQVTDTDPGFKGDTATGGTKLAKLETGITIQVPLFINVGDVVKVDTRTAAYSERIS